MFYMLILFAVLCKLIMLDSYIIGSNGPYSFGLAMGRASVVRADTKSKTDAMKCKLYTTYAKRISNIVKSGGSNDPVVNRPLAQLLQEARDANVPKDVIARNLDKSIASSSSTYKELTYEFYGHGGIGLLVHVLTDNEHRSSADVALVAKKHDLKSAAMNSVKFKFDSKARFDIQPIINEDELMELCLVHDIDDYSLRKLEDTGEKTSTVLIDIPDTNKLRDCLRSHQYQVSVKIQSIPKEELLSVSTEDYALNRSAIDAFEQLDDVHAVEHNMMNRRR